MIKRGCGISRSPFCNEGDSMATNLYLVIPCYNEDQILEHSMDNIYGLMENMVLQGLISGDSKIILVDDGSESMNLLEQMGAVKIGFENLKDLNDLPTPSQMTI